MTGVFLQYNGDSLYLAAFAASLGVLYYRERKRNRRNRRKNYAETTDSMKKAVTALVLALFFVFNEAAYQIVGKLTDTTTYYRFFWMLPVLFVIAYLLTEAFASEKKVRITAAIAAFAVCLAFGENLFFLNRMYWNLPQNIYGLDANTITIADEIMADWERTDGARPETTGQENKAAGSGAVGRELADAPVAAFDMYLEYQVRTYEPRIRWGLTRQAYLYQAEHGYDHKKYSRQQYIMAAVNEGIKEDSKVLKHCLDKNGINYLAIRTEFDMDDYLAEISVLPIAHSVSYTLYKVKE